MDIMGLLSQFINTSKLGGWVRALVAAGFGILIAKWPGLKDYVDPATQAEIGAAVATIVVGVWSHMAKSQADKSASVKTTSAGGK